MTTEEQFIKKHKDTWESLSAYNKRLSGSRLSKLTCAQIKEYAELYRQAGHHYAYAQTYYENGKCVSYLNSLLGHSHAHFYRRKKGLFTDIIQYFTVGFARAAREYGKLTRAALCAFLAGAALIMALSFIDSSYIFYFVDEQIVQNNNITGELSRETWFFPLISSVIMTNNIRVAALCIAFGTLAGVGTLWVLFQNGLALGAMYAMVAVYGMSHMRFWSLILPHGIIELAAVFIAGGAGLSIGKGLLIPGELSRSHGFIKGAKQAFYLLPGITAMLVIAGIIEGFFTPLAISEGAKLLFAGLTAGLVIAYFGLCGRDNRTT